MKLAAIAIVAAALGAAHAATPINPTQIIEPSNSALRAVAGIGDVNGDGYADYAIGEPYLYQSAGEQYGRVYVYYGSPSGPGLGPDWPFWGTINFGNVGYAVAGGDLNGDGYDDLVVTGHSSPGFIYAFFGSATGLPLKTTPDWSVVPHSSDVNDVAVADIDHDGYADVIYGDPTCSHGQIHEGCVTVYRGGPSGPATSPSWSYESNQAEARLGESVARLARSNGDVYDDIAVGAPGYDGQGKVFIFHGSATGLPASPSRTIGLSQAGASFGESVSSAGDVNGDGFEDLVVGAPYYDGTLSNEGGVFVYLGSAAGIGSAPVWQAVSGQAGAYLGTDVASAGDFNHDGFPDLIAGAPGYDITTYDEGEVLIFMGNGSTFSSAPSYVAYGKDQQGGFGNRVAGIGDTDGDGFPEIVAAEHAYSVGAVANLYTLGPPRPAGAVPTTAGSPGLTLEWDDKPSLSIHAAWPASCADEQNYGFYEGHLGDFTSHVPLTCSTKPYGEVWFTAPVFSSYYLVVPQRLGSEGSYGTTSAGVERTPSASACAPQFVAACP